MCCSPATWAKGRLAALALLGSLAACAGELLGGRVDGMVTDRGAAPDGAMQDRGPLADGAAKPDRKVIKPDSKGPKPDSKAPKPDQKIVKPDSQPPSPPPLDLKKVKWLHTNVSGWPATAKLSSVTFSSSNICLNYDKANVWSKNQISGVDVNANPWVFIYHSGLWYGATWEWLRPGQTCKARTSVAGDHIKQSPFDAASGWKPKKGQVLYFMVSGLARMGNITNVKERTAPVKVTWP